MPRRKMDFYLWETDNIKMCHLRDMKVIQVNLIEKKSV